MQRTISSHIRRRRVWLILACVLTLLAPLGVQAAGAPPALTTLQPGGVREIAQNLPINVVFLGYHSGSGARDINEAAFRAGLPHGYHPIDRDASLYSTAAGGAPVFENVSYTYNYNLVYATSAFEDAFFNYLTSIAVPRPLTIYQAYGYNVQQARSLTITNNAWIDATSAEKWLATNTTPMLGVNTQQDTIFFVNWFGRPDFKFHVYTKTNEPDPETGRNFGLAYDSRKMIAWGGTSPDDQEDGYGTLARIWFYDLSAGPDAWTNNWELDHADLDGNGVMDYRIPPVWEYGNTSAYRPFNDLSGDLAKVLRYVALDLLFTPSPLYKPAISAPALPSKIELDANIYQLDPTTNGRDFVHPSVVLGKLGKLQPFNSFTMQIKDAPLTAEAVRTYNCWRTWEVGPNAPIGKSCYGNKVQGYAFYDLFVYHSQHLMQFIEGDADYEVPAFLYNTPDYLMSHSLAGLAEDNLRDGTQSFVNAWSSPFWRSIGYGFSGSLIHEMGHHLGLSHPHDGYDSESTVALAGADQFAFIWAGDESNTIMSYLAVEGDFSQFDRDNMDRWMTATYINQANAVLGKIYASPRVGEASSLLTTADTQAASALNAYTNMDYLTAVTRAKQAYQGVMTAAAQIQVHVEPQAWQSDYKARGASFKFADTVDKRMTLP